MCSQKLWVPVDAGRREQAHRIQIFRTDRRRPIVVKFSFFKDKESLPASRYKFKDSGFAVGESFSKSAQLARGNLLEPDRAQESRFRLRVDRLQIGEENYILYHESRSARESGYNNGTKKTKEGNDARHNCVVYSRTLGYLSLLVANVRSRIPKQEKLTGLVDSCSCDIVFGTETWLSSDTSDAELTIFR